MFYNALTPDRYNTHVRFLIISDPHANWHALQAVLSDAEGQYDQIICCGDLVGYNAQPGRVLEWTRQHCAAVIRGNHDKVVGGQENLEWFNEVAQTAARWTMDALDTEQIQYLHDLAKGPLKLQHFHIWHGSPRDEDEYVTIAGEAIGCFEYFELPLAFFGHTHLQGGFFLTKGRIGAVPKVHRDHHERVLELEPDVLYMINPGSVGQPRDGDGRAAYTLFDSEANTVTLRRVRYPIEKTAQEIEDAGLPDMLAYRLFQGM
ncbi:MAG: metallophosphoesterase family protein [Bryobacteraceae bacterium]